jgi:peptidoglycan/LPS O-acetylase OafA/YrhL
MLWTVSPALPITKIVLTAVGLAAALTPLTPINYLLNLVEPLKAVFVYLGSISYALYAIHVPILILLKLATPDVAWIRLLLFTGCLLAAAHFLEQVLQPFLRQKLVWNTQPRHSIG